jgi:lipopolysaccharide/colanic/teichoic acid biosynthesis glycosyltransferase
MKHRIGSDECFDRGETGFATATSGAADVADGSNATKLKVSIMRPLPGASRPNRCRSDHYYIDNWSLWFDLRILLLTLFSRGQ